MNAIFKVIWNRSLNVWVAVGEFAKGKQKSTTAQRSFTSQYIGDTLNQYIPPKIAVLAVAIMSAFGIQPALAITAAQCTAMGASCVAVGTAASLATALSNTGVGSAATTILLTANIDLSTAYSGGITVNQAANARQNLVIDGGGYDLKFAGYAFNMFSGSTNNAAWAAENATLELTNFKDITSTLATTSGTVSRLVYVQDATTRLSVTLNNINSVPNGKLVAMGADGAALTPNNFGRVIFGNITQPITLNFGTYRQAVLANNIAFTGKFYLTGITSPDYPAVFWSNGTAANSVLTFANGSDVSLTGTRLTNGPGVVGAGVASYSYMIEDGAKLRLNIGNQNPLGVANYGVQIGSYNTVNNTFGAGATVIINSQPGDVISNAPSTVATSYIYNGPASTNNVIYNLAAGSSLETTNGTGILASKTGVANGGGIYISSGGTIAAATGGITATHAGTGNTRIENKTSGVINSAGTGIAASHTGTAGGNILIENGTLGVINAATGMAAFSYGTGTTNIVNKGTITATASGITIGGSAVKVANIDNTGGTIITSGTATGLTGITVSDSALLNLVGGTLNLTGAAYGVVFTQSAPAGAHNIADLIVNLGDAGRAFLKSDATNVTLRNVKLNTVNGTALNSLAGLTFATSANGRNEINVTGTGTGIATVNTALTGWSPAALDINVSGAGTGINASGGGVDLSSANLNVSVTNSGGTGLRVADGAVAVTTIGANAKINAAGATAINFAGTTAKTLNNNGTINGAVTFAGSAANTINNNGILNGTLTTGAGNDTLVLASTSQSNELINLGDGNNNVTIQNGARVSSIAAGAGDDIVTINNMTAGSTYLGALNAGSGSNTLNFNQSVDTLATATSLQGFTNINLTNSQIGLSSVNNVGSGSAINIDSNSKILFNSTFNGTLNASLGHVVAGDGLAVVNNGANVTLNQANTFEGGWQVVQGGILTASNSNQLGTATIALDGTLNLNGVPNSNNALTGNGTLNIDTTNNTFNFGVNTGSAFAGTVDMKNSIFALSGDNTAALGNASFIASAGTAVAVGNGNQAVGNFVLNGGTAAFASGSLISAGTLAVTNNSNIRVDPTLTTGGNLLDQDTGTSTQLINSSNVLSTTELARLTLRNIQGDVLGANASVNVIQGANTVAQAIYNYGLSGVGGGLSVTSALTQLALLSGQTLTLTSQGAVNGDHSLLAQLTGVGNLAIGADNSDMTLNNATNDYTGSTSVNGGILNLGSNNALGQTSALNTAAGTTTNINGHSQTVGALTNAGTVTLGTGAALTSGLLTNNNILNIAGGTLNLSAGGASTATGGLTGSGILNINGGDLAISAANSGLAGQTNIASGATATLSGAGTLGTSAVNVLGNLNLNGANAALANVLSGNGNINTNAAVTLTGTSSFSGAHHIGTNGALTVTQASNLGASAATVGLDTATSHLVLKGVNGTIANALSGVAGSTVDVTTGANTTLTGNNSNFLGQYAVAGNSKLTVGSTNNLGASSNITLAGAQDTLALNGFNGTFSNTVTGSGILQVTGGSNATLTSSNALANAVAVDIADATLNLDDIALFDHALTGNGTLNVAKNSASTAFDFGSSVGGAFSGTANLTNSTFDLNGMNSSALTNATLKLSSGNMTSVADGVQNIGALAMNGGTMLFNHVVDNAGIISSEGTFAANSINTTGGGNVRVNLPVSLAPSLDGLPVMELDEGEIIVKLGTGAATGSGRELTLTDQNGGPISAVFYQGVYNPGGSNAAAIGSFNYGLTTGNDYDGLYVNYGLTGLELQSTGSDALILTATLANNGKQSNDLSTQISGSGDLAFVSADDGGIASLSNATNNYTGATWVRSGILRLNANSALGQTSQLAMSNATTVDLNGTQQTVGQLTTETGSTLNFNNGKLAVTNGGQVDGALSGAGELALSGGSLSVTQGNTGFTGSTDIASGATAHLYQAQGLGSGAINNNGVLNLDNTTGVLSNNLAGASGNTQLTNNANIRLAGDNSGYSGLFTTDSGAVLTANSAQNLGNSRIANSGELILDTASVWELTNAISGKGALIKRGSGTVKIEGSTVSASQTTIENGLLQLGSLPVISALYVEESPLARSLSVSLASTIANLTSNVLITTTGSLGGYGKVTGNVENNGRLIMPNALTGGDFGTFTIDGNYTGNNGTVVFNTVLAGDSSNSDRLLITGNTAGQSYVTVNNIGGNGGRTSDGIKIINVGGDSAGQFTLNGRAVAGAYEYFLYQGSISSPTDGDWYLRTEVDERRPEPASYTANLAAANTMFVTTLADRAGETLYTDVFTGEEKTTSLWLRNEGTHNRSRDDSGELKTQDNRYVMQLGGDVAQWSRNAQDLWRVGVMAGYANSSSSSVAQMTGYRSNGSVDGYSVGVYGTWFANDQQNNSQANTGAYVDSWLQYSWFNNQVDGQDLTAEKYDSKGFTAAIESGYTFKVRESAYSNFFIQPKAQVVWMGVKADSHTETNGTLVTGEGNNNIQTRLGAKAFISPIQSANKAKEPAFKPYVEANWIHNTKDFGTTLDGITVKQAGAANIAELKLGVEGQINKKLNLWGNVGQQLGNNGYSDSSITLGVKYNF
ncbi:autotransporter outer membrane beta-barrel domain-containing protein [Yersinia thracica]|uniref:autotransporter outer membrane beta-barrel domain-containing protein n=1 Tax=Yersinia thracica TaxID=2890319 RepID=UPI0011A3E8AF|nr:autotransporter outer membrane beta-barrel domain-containing protein [Yersinia thracica]